MTRPQPSNEVSKNIDALQIIRRWPDVEAANLFAIDAADRLILDEAYARCGADVQSVVIINDHYGALTIGAAALFSDAAISVTQDSVVHQRALDANAERLHIRERYTTVPLDPVIFQSAELILLRIPRARADLAYTMQVVGHGLAMSGASSDVALVGGGMIKHMHVSMNEEFAAVFDRVQASLARGKARVIHASGPLGRAAEAPGLGASTAPAAQGDPAAAPTSFDPAFPMRTHHPDLGFDVFAYGAVFGGTRLDSGTSLLLSALSEHNIFSATEPARVLDLGCGSGILATAVARTWSQLSVVATDASAQAAASARLTAASAQVSERVTVTVDDVGSELPAESFDVIVCNPPFHSGGQVLDGVAIKMFHAAARLLKPGGKLITVYNTTLPYYSQLSSIVGSTKVIANNSKFTVTASRRRTDLSTLPS